MENYEESCMNGWELSRGQRDWGFREDLRDCVRVVGIIKIHPLQIHWREQRREFYSATGRISFPGMATMYSWIGTGYIISTLGY